MGFGQQGRHNDFTLQTALSFCYLQSWRDGLLNVCSHLLAGQNLVLTHATQLFGVFVAKHVTLTSFTENNFPAASNFEAFGYGFFRFVHGEKVVKKIDKC